jgi:hypothetical protein
MCSIEIQLNKDEFWQAAKNARSFAELVTALKRFQGFQSNAIFQIMFKKCLEFTGTGFVLTDDFAVWRRILVALADDDGILFIFENGLMIEFHQDKGGKARMHIFTAGEGNV